MKNIPLNVKVVCSDGECGKSSHVIINPLDWVVTYIVVDSDRLRGSKQRLVPFENIVETTHRSIHLNCTFKQLAAMDKFTETHFINSDEAEYAAFSSNNNYNYIDNYISDEIDLYSVFPYAYSQSDLYSVTVEDERIPPGEIAVRRGANVRATNGYVGRIDEFVIDPKDGRVTHLVVREGYLWDKKELTLPLSAVARLDEYVVELNLDKKTVKSLPAIPFKRFYSLNY